MRQPLKVGLPVPNVLIVDSIDHMLAHDVVGLIGIGLVSQEIRGNKIHFMNRRAFVTSTDGGEHLVPQPCQVSLQVGKNQWRREVPCERLVSMKEVLRVAASDKIKRIEQPGKIALFVERCTQIRHEDVPHEHYFSIGKIDQHGVVGLAPSSRDQLDLRSANVQAGPFVDRHVRLVPSKILKAKPLSEKLFTEGVRRVEFSVEFLLIVLPTVKPGTRVQPPEVRMATDMVPMRMSNQHGGERR